MLRTDQVLARLGLITVPAVGSQVLGSRLRVPALIILLPAGFAPCAIANDDSPDKFVGPAFQPPVTLGDSGERL